MVKIYSKTTDTASEEGYLLSFDRIQFSIIHFTGVRKVLLLHTFAVPAPLS